MPRCPACNRDVPLSQTTCPACATPIMEDLAAAHGLAGTAKSGCLGVLLLSLLLLASSFAIADERSVTITAAKKDQRGFLIHAVESPFQAGPTEIRVLLPDRLDPSKRYPVLYVLPVEARNENQYGDGLQEVMRKDLHNKHQAIFVAPTFSHLPWYADHPTKAEIRQESYFVNVVVPFIEKTYTVQTEASGRFLLGFSKSGWGAFSLLLRHPDRFGKAAAWDAPLMMDMPGRYGSGAIFGTPENFESYRITKLSRGQATKLQKEKRLILLGYGNFRDQHEKIHVLMTEWKIAHEYRDGPLRKHDWHSGWVAEAVALLLAVSPSEG